MKTILYVCSTLPVGGVQVHLKTVVTRLAPYGYRPIVCCMGDNGQIGEEITAMGVEVVELNRMKRRSFDAGIIKDIMRLIRSRSIDLVHTHLYHANMYGRVAAVFSRVPMVATVHNVNKFYSAKRNIVNRLLARRSAGIIAVSKAVKADAVKWGLSGDMVDVIYNGIDISDFTLPSMEDKASAKLSLGLDATTPVVGVTSRLTRPKGHVHLINALKAVKARVGGVKLLVIGSGPLEDALRVQARSLGLDGDVTFLGSRRDVPELLKALDVFVMPSTLEGLGISLLEAMAASLPVVITNVGGMPEVVEHDISALVVEPANAEALSGALIDLLTNPTKAQAFAHRGREIIEQRFLADTMVKLMVRLYDRVLGVKGVASGSL